MTLKALIIDDEPLAHKVILEYVRDVAFIDIVGQCYLATEALAVLHRQPVDLLFLDIKMPKLEGLDFLRTLPHPPLVIITSAYEEYALQSFELNVVDYLLKPFRFERFLKAVNKALEWKQLRRGGPETVAVGTPEAPKQLFIKSDKRHVQLALDDIYFLESYGNYVKVWLDKTYHLTPGTLSGFEEQLPAPDFLRVHKSFLIQGRHIDYLEGNMLVMRNGKRVPVGKNYRGATKAMLG